MNTNFTEGQTLYCHRGGEVYAVVYAHPNALEGWHSVIDVPDGGRFEVVESDELHVTRLEALKQKEQGILYALERCREEMERESARPSDCSPSPPPSLSPSP